MTDHRIKAPGEPWLVHYGVSAVFPREGRYFVDVYLRSLVAVDGAWCDSWAEAEEDTLDKLRELRDQLNVMLGEEEPRG